MAETIQLISEEGEEIELRLIDIATVNNKDYALLSPIEEDEITLMHFIKNGEEYSFEPIEDDREFEEVSKILEEEYSLKE